MGCPFKLPVLGKISTLAAFKMHDPLRNLQCSANCATKLRLVKQANSLPLTPLSATPQPACCLPPATLLAAAARAVALLVRHFQYSFLLDATLTVAQANAAGVRGTRSVALPSGAPCCCCCCMLKCPHAVPRESRLSDSCATPRPLFVFVNFDLFAAYFALCATGTACCQCKLISRKTIWPPVLAAVVVIAAVCQPISFGSVFWQVNMRFSKYFCLFVECVRHVCLPFAHIFVLFFYTLPETRVEMHC